MGAAASTGGRARNGGLDISLADRAVRGLIERWRVKKCRVIRNAAELVLATLIMLWSSAQAFGQTAQPVQPPNSLKSLSLDQLQAIEVTSVSKRPERLSEVPSSIQVITADDIRRSGVTSIPEALRLASNLHVAQIDSHDWAITARGFNNVSANKLLVLMDGRVVYTPLHAGVYWDVQDTLLEDIEQIEVISGPGATLWGANAVNGVINIITKKAGATQGVLVTGAAGSELQGAVGLRYGGSIGNDLQFRAYGRSFSRDTSALPAGRQAADAWHMGQGGFRLDWDTSPVNHVTVQSDIYDGRIGQLNTKDGAATGASVLGRWSHTLSKDSDASIQIYYDGTERTQPGVLDETLRTYATDFEHRFRLVRRHNIVWGLGYRASVSDQTNSAALAVLPPHLSRQWLSGFVQDQVALGADLQLTLGMKVEHNDYTGVEFQPSARVAWTLSRRQVLWGAVSRAVRTPSQVDRGLFIPIPGTPLFLIAGGPDFVSEDLRAYEVGYRTEPFDRLSLTAASFYNDYGHIRSLERLVPLVALPLVFANLQSGESYGVELTAEYRITDWWRIRSGYTGLHLRIRPDAGSTDRTFGSTESHDPGYYGLLRQSLDLPARLQLDLGFRYVGAIVNQTVPAFVELDASLAWQASSTIELSVAGRNLLHRYHPEFASPATRREAERGINGKLVWRF